MKKVIYTLIILGIVGGIAFTLASNKEEMEQEVIQAQKTNDFIPVVTTKVKEEKIATEARATGNFQPIRELTLLSETQGRVIKVMKEKGDFVQTGELLAKVDDTQLRANLKAQEASYKKAQKDLERFETLAEGEAITQRELEEVRLNVENIEAQLTSLKKQLADTYIKAPISGTLNDKYIEVGSFLTPGASIYEIVNTQSLKMVVKVSEQDVLNIQEGQEVSVRADVYKDQSYTGTVEVVGVKADNALRYPVEIHFKNNPEKPLKAGMFGTAYFSFQQENETRVIPREAIVGGLQNPSIYVVEDSTAKLQNISVGSTIGKQVELVEGPAVGTPIVVSGQINLENGMKVSVLKQN